MWRTCAEQLSGVYTDIFNLSLAQTVVPSLPPALEPHQYAYHFNRSTEDAISTALHSALTQLDNSISYARMLFIDFGSVFNTITPSDLIMKLHKLGISISICNWILDFLINGPKR